MAKVIWTKRAFDQLERNVKFLKTERGITVAELVLTKILDSVSQLENFPDRGQTEPLLIRKKSVYRYLIVWSYKVIYRVEKERVIISRVFHTSRNPEKLKGV
ncbi:MAG TPA: type II toxin-antitoxin system RelE/ParE family toxin [Cyclobacteriaceae bacterium]